MRTFPTLSAVLVAASLLLLPGATQAQKALVYCPPTDNATCATLVTTLSATGGYPGGVDRAYDGTAGSVDLKTADLFPYTVFFVPSLSDGEAGTPYALLRDATVAGRLRAALIGRRAFWSGTPDLGASNRDKKNALIANLASWAGAKFATVQGPGLVVLQDNSENEAAQYNWVNGIVGFAVTSDWDPKSYASVRTISAAGVAIVTSNGASLSYENMASYGFYFPDGAAGVSLDAVGQTGTAVGGEVVLVTSEGANTGGATIKTDKNDYAPGTTVVMTGAGFGAGETVSLTLHEDPLVHEDRTFSATADASGAFTFSGFAPEQHHIGVRFVLTAVGQASGKRAQTTFTDGYQISVGVSATPGSSITITYRLFANNTCGGALPAAATVNVVSGGPSVVVASNLGSQQSLQLSAPSTGPNLLSFGQWTVAPINAGTPAGASTSTMCVQGNGANANNNQGSYTYTANYPVSVAATTAITSSLNPSAFGASITLTATLSPANAVGTVQFTDGGVNVGAPVTVAAGVATLTTSALNVGSHAISAVFTPGTGFTAGAVTGLTQVVDKATAVVTLGGLTATYDGSPKSVTASTMPAGLPLEITYNGLATAPTTTGAYTVIATVNSPSYQGSATGTLTIGKAAQTISFPQPANLTYGGSGLQVSGTASSNLLVTFEATGACTIATGGAQNMVSPTSAGTCTVTATQPGDANYDAAPSVQYSVIVAPRTIAIGSVTVANKPYDGNTTATITARTLADGAALSGDDVSLTGGTATFADKTVGAGKSVNVTLLALTGTHAANYALGSSSITTTASITALTVTPVVTVSNKVYDATTAATIATSDVTGKITGDVVTLSGGTAEFADKKVGSGKSVSVTGLVLSGTDGGNYTLSANTASATADITPATINGSFTAENKTYDATIAATIATRNIGSGLLLSDDVTLTGGTATFADKNVGNGKTVTGAGFALGGTDGGNYALAAVPTTTANITAAPITPVFTASNKVYDATTTATIATRSLTGKLGSDAVTLDGGTATFADKTVGTGKTVNAAGFTIIGGDATNYSLGAPASTTADITKAPITASVT
ncbi:MAG: YDG domain-containing protein, partial [Gemmatimonadota bacterium]